MDNTGDRTRRKRETMVKINRMIKKNRNYPVDKRAMRKKKLIERRTNNDNPVQLRLFTNRVVTSSYR